MYADNIIIYTTFCSPDWEEEIDDGHGDDDDEVSFLSMNKRTIGIACRGRKISCSHLFTNRNEHFTTYSPCRGKCTWID